MTKIAEQVQEEKAIKKGYAYRHFKRKRIWINVLFGGWGIGMPLIPGALGNTLVLVIYIVVALGLYLLCMRYMFFKSWICPKCKAELPTKPQLYRFSTKDPELVSKCLYCGYDLTKNNKGE